MKVVNLSVYFGELSLNDLLAFDGIVDMHFSLFIFYRVPILRGESLFKVLI